MAIDNQIKEAIARSWQWQMERGVVRPSSDGYRYRYQLKDVVVQNAD